MFKWLKTRSLRRRLIILFLIIGLGPAAITVLVTRDIAHSHLLQQTFAQLDAVRQLKGSAVQRYINGIQKQIITMAEDSTTITAINEFNKALSAPPQKADNTQPSATLRNYYEQQYGDHYEAVTGYRPNTESLLSQLSPKSIHLQQAYIADNPHELGNKHLLNRAPGDSAYHAVHDRHHPDFRNVIERFDYYDIFLVDAASNCVVYSVFKELDFATSMTTGPFAHSSAGKAYKEALLLAKGEFSMYDFEPYSPTYEHPASFIASPIFDGKKRIGVLMFQVPLEPLNNIMNERSGMRDTGESYLLGKDQLMRSDSFLSPTKYSVLNSFHNPGNSQIESISSQQALRGITGNALITDYLGNEVLSSFGLLDFGPFEWALVVKINADEALESTQIVSKVVSWLLLISAFVVVLLAFMITRHLTRPLKELADASMAVANGTRDVMISPAQDIEVNQLTSAFNHMLTARQQHEQKLEFALNEAKQSARAKNDFLASMSHEIRTPMNGVLGMLSLVQNAPLNDTQRHRIEIAEGSAKSLLNLINDILDFSKIDAGKLELEMLDFNPRQLLGDVAESMAYLAQNKHLELILDLQHIDESMVIGDSSRVRQILTNLVNNAIKFTEIGEVLIRAELFEQDAEHWTLKCQISDTGIGIPEAKVDQLFQAFSQVDASTTREYGGTGLGLAIVKRLCELMNGAISVTSKEGQGSCFEVMIHLEKSKQSQRVIPSVDLSKLDVLIVDDNHTNREVLLAQLSHWGAKVSEVGSGQEAIKICEERASRGDLFDIAILDMQMPHMDGATLAQHLKSDDSLSPMKLVMMTSMGQSEDSHYFMRLGFDAYFPKPVTTSDLFNALSIISAAGEDTSEATPIVTSNYLQTLKPNIRNRPVRHTMPYEGKRILVVEDNPVNQLVASGLLNQLGIKADIAANGHEAISSLRQAPENSPYQLVLMDCQMPEMDGYEATRQIRKGESGRRNREIYIIALTANAMTGDREACIEAGMNDYLSKPIELASLEAKLTVWLAPN